MSGHTPWREINHKRERPWFAYRIGFTADDEVQAEAWLDAALELLPYPHDFIASGGHSESLSRGEGFEDDA